METKTTGPARHSIITTATISNSATNSVLRAAAKRVAILFSPPSANAYSVGLDKNVVLDQGITLTANSAPVKLTLEEHGDVVTRGWWARASAATPTTIGIFETYEETP